MKPTNQSTSGTNFFDVTIHSSLKDLKSKLGKPHIQNEDEKVQYEWKFENENEDVFTVYDYKEYRKIKSNEIIEWHIGGHNKGITEQAKYEIENTNIHNQKKDKFIMNGF